jgi:hypothetical protein
LICFVDDISCLFLLFSEIAIACKLLTRQIDCRRVRGAGLTAPFVGATNWRVVIAKVESLSELLHMSEHDYTPAEDSLVPAVRALPALVNPLDIRGQDVVVQGEKTRCRIFEIRNTIFYGRSL